MEPCCHVWSFARQLRARDLDTATVLRYFHSLGARVVELTDGFIPEHEVATLQALLAESGLTVGCYDVINDFVTPDPAARQAEVQTLQAALERAARFGARYVLTYPGYQKEHIRPEDARHWFAEALRACVPIATRLGLTLTVADIGTQALLCGTSDHLASLCEAVGPELGVTYDVGNFLLAGEDPLAALERVAPRVVHAHVKDWTIRPASAERPDGAFIGLDGRSYCGAVLGEGVLDLGRILGRLAQRGYRGYLSLEYEGTGDPWQAVERGWAALRTLVADLPTPP
jgi:sugar phosphate isomerase/epimerase